MSKFRPTRRGVLKAVAAVTTALAMSGGTLIATAPPASAVEDAAGLHIEKRDEQDPRMKYFQFSTPEIGWNPSVNVLLPDGYDPGRRYPVLYLFHGGGTDQNFMAWDKMGIRQVSAGKDIIIVMPDGGPAGWYSNPVSSNSGPRNWENFHIDQLIPWVDANFPTYAEADGRAVAGFSMGGFGALKYMATHPDLFASVSSHSGPADLRHDFGAVGHWANLSSAAVELAGGTVYGVPWDEAKVSRDNPAENIESFRGKRIFLSAGTGPFRDLANAIPDANEVEVLPNQRAFRARLDQAGIPHEGREHGAGHVVDPTNFTDDLNGIIDRLRKAS